MKLLTTLDSSKCEEWLYDNAKITYPRISDPEILGENLREADKQEIRAVIGDTLTYAQALEVCAVTSDPCYVVRSLVSEEPLAMYGVCPQMEGGEVWFLGSDELFETNKMAFLRNSKIWVEKLFDGYDLLYNVVDARNVLHIRWLKWLGFTFIEDIPEYGVEKRRFKQFYKRKQ